MIPELAPEWKHFSALMPLSHSNTIKLNILKTSHLGPNTSIRGLSNSLYKLKSMIGNSVLNSQPPLNSINSLERLGTPYTKLVFVMC